MTIKLRTILKKLLHEHDLTAAQLARATKIAPQTINNWLSGQEPRSLNQIKAVADYFDISVDYLVYGKEEKKEKIQDYEAEINANVALAYLKNKDPLTANAYIALAPDSKQSKFNNQLIEDVLKKGVVPSNKGDSSVIKLGNTADEHTDLNDQGPNKKLETNNYQGFSEKVFFKQ